MVYHSSLWCVIPDSKGSQNRLQTLRGRGFDVYMRLYIPFYADFMAPKKEESTGGRWLLTQHKQMLKHVTNAVKLRLFYN